MSVSAIRARRWSRVEYERLIAHGLFQPGERLELIGGEMLVREPQGDPHALAMELVGDALRGALGLGWRVRVQLPVALAEDSEPEPDFSIVRGVARRITGRSIPSRPALIVEVADSRLRFDRRQKGSLYARAGVADYWIVNLGKRALEVRRHRTHGSAVRLGLSRGPHARPCGDRFAPRCPCGLDPRRRSLAVRRRQDRESPARPAAVTAARPWPVSASALRH
jgi:Uma2 family endonuclease